MPTLRLSEIAARIGAHIENGSTPESHGTLSGSPGSPESADPEILGVAGIREAVSGQITFLANLRYQMYVADTRATALIVGPDFSAPASARQPVKGHSSTRGHAAGNGRRPPLIYLRVENPYLAFVQVLRLYGTERPRRPAGIDPTAILAPDVRTAEGVSIGPNVVIEAGAAIGNRTVIMAGCFIGEGVTIGDDCMLYPNITIREGVEIGHRVLIHPGAVLGSDGFGFVRDGQLHHKIPQLGSVVVEDDVEIGANVAIDRATTGVTRISRHVKIDNLVQIAHNVVIGPNSLVCAQVGIAGSTELGANVVLGGQSGLVGHITLGDNVGVGAQSGVTKSIPANTRVSGYPALEHETALRVEAHTRRLPELARELKALRARLSQLERDIEKERERVL